LIREVRYLIAGIPFLGSMMEIIFKQISLMHYDSDFKVYNTFMDRFLHSRRYLYIFFIFIFLIKLSLSIHEPINWMHLPLIKTYKLFMEYFIDFIIESLIIVYVIWITLNISWSLSDFKRESANFLERIDVYGLHALDPLRENIYIVSFYYLILSFSITTYFIFLSYYYYYYDQAVAMNHFLDLGSGLAFYIIFMLFSVIYGSVFFILGLKSLNDASKWRIEFELQDLNKLYQENFSKFKLLLTNNKGNLRSEEIDVISKSLQTLRDERESIMKIKTEGNILAAATFFIISIVPPIIALINLINSII
jgi:hypothetical protein